MTLAPRTLFDKIWESHLVDVQEDGTCLLYIDRHLVHEVTSPQAFEGLRMTGRGVRRPKATLAVADHNVPTTDRSHGIADDGIAHSGRHAGGELRASSASPTSRWPTGGRASSTSSARSRASRFPA